MESDELGNLSSVVSETHQIVKYQSSEEDPSVILSSSSISPLQVTSHEDHAYIDQDTGIHVTGVEVVDGNILLDDESNNHLTSADNLVPVVLNQQPHHHDNNTVELIHVDPNSHPELSGIESALDSGQMVTGTLDQSILTAQGGQVQLLEDNELHQVVLVTPSSENDGQQTISQPPAKKSRRVVKRSEKETSYIFTLGETPVNEEPKMRKNPHDASVLSVSKQTEGSVDGGPILLVDLGSEDGDEEAGNTDISQAWFTSRDDKAALQSKGHQWRQGQWSREEVEKLQHNIAVYCQERDMEDPTDIIFNVSKEERKDFYRTIAKGLQRPLFSVYRRVIRMYDRKNHIGKYGPDEINQLKRLREVHGTDWATIGAALGRSASSVKDRCRLMRDTCNSGKWLPEEEKRLTQAVYELSGVPPGEPVTQGLSWSMVSEKVATRTEKQCRTKWLNYLNWKHSGGVEWTRDDDIQLIKRLTELGVTDDTQVDWSELATEMKSARSPQWLRGKWWSIKRHVPNYQQRSLADILKHLKQMGTLDIRTKLPISATLNAAASMDAQQQQQQQLAGANITLAIPVNSIGNGCVLEDKTSGGKPRELEILQGVSAASSSQQLLLSQNSDSAIAISSSSMAGDHIILHMMPVTQLRSDDNSGVDVNQQIIINNTGAVGTEAVQVLSEGAGTVMEATHAEGIDMQLVGQALINNPQNRDFQTLNEVDVISHYVDVNGSINVEGGITSHTQLIADHSTFRKPPALDGPHLQGTSLNVISTENDEDEEDDRESQVGGGTPTVSLTSASHDSSNLIHNMSSLTDPMLTSESDLICSSVDIEGVKGQETGHADSDPSTS